jgi:hypothetical protein
MATTNHPKNIASLITEKRSNQQVLSQAIKMLDGEIDVLKQEELEEWAAYFEEPRNNQELGNRKRKVELDDMVDYQDHLYDMEEKRLFYPEFEKYDVTFELPTRSVKNSYPKKRLVSKKAKARRAKRLPNRSRTHQHGDRDWDVQKSYEQDVLETMQQEIKDDKDYMEQELEEENNRLESIRIERYILESNRLKNNMLEDELAVPPRDCFCCICAECVYDEMEYEKSLV